MVAQHYRWDFIGLSSQEKPTPQTSEKVVDGSTFYEADTSKLYVFCKTQWYEKESTGGGGGSSVNVVQTTGTSTTDVMSQNAVTEALASAGGGGGITFLSASDFNYDDGNTGSFNTVALWLLDDGFYFMPSDYTTVPVKGALGGTNYTRLNSNISSDSYYCFIKANASFWIFTNMSRQDSTLKSDRPIFFCKITAANGWLTAEAGDQLAKRSELTS